MGFINQFPYSDFHELNLDWLIKQTKANMDLIKELQETIAQIQVLTKDQIDAMINSAINANNEILYTKMTQLKAEITNEYTTMINNQIAQLKVYLDNQDLYYFNLGKEYSDNILVQAKAYSDSQVIDYTMMINPITGEYDDVRNVVDDIIIYFHSDNSLTAQEYDDLDLTATAYDAYNISAYDYDFNGKTLLV